MFRRKFIQYCAGVSGIGILPSFGSIGSPDIKIKYLTLPSNRLVRQARLYKDKWIANHYVYLSGKEGRTTHKQYLKMIDIDYNRKNINLPLATIKKEISNHYKLLHHKPTYYLIVFCDNTYNFISYYDYYKTDNTLLSYYN